MVTADRRQAELRDGTGDSLVLSFCNGLRPDQTSMVDSQLRPGAGP